MRVRLLTRWGSRLRGDIFSVSDERARLLEAEGIAKALEPWPVAEANPEPPANDRARTRK